jgi:hypothetical protein
MCMSSPKMPDLPPPLPPPPPATKIATAPESARAMTGTTTKRRRGTKRLTVSRRPTLGMQSSGQTGVNLTT